MIHLPTIFFVESELQCLLDINEKTESSTSAPIQSTPKSNLISKKITQKKYKPTLDFITDHNIETEYMVQYHLLKLYFSTKIHISKIHTL